MSTLRYLKSDLTSLKYSKDRVDGGYSGQPYIQKDIENAKPTNAGLTAANKDFLLRGGTAAATSAVTDAARLAKYFFDLKSPSGLLFIAKQNLLSQTGVETQANLKPNEGVYTPLSTLAQSITNIAGVHLNKQGLNPIPGSPGSLRTYTDKDVKEKVKGGINGFTNRLVELHNTKIKDQPITTTSGYNNISPVNNDLLSYGGGPGSILGIGKTDIPIFSIEERTGLNNPKLKNSEFFEKGYSVFKGKSNDIDVNKVYLENSSTVSSKFNKASSSGQLTGSLEEFASPLGSYINANQSGSFVIKDTTVYPLLQSLNNFAQNKSSRIYDNGTVVYTQEQIGNERLTFANTINPGSFQQDFRTKIIDNPNSKYIMGIAPSYVPADGKTIEGTKGSRVHMTSPGQSGDRKNYVKGKIISSKVSVVDEINFQPIYESEKVREKDGIKKNDLVKFRIAALNKNNPNKKQFIHFRAFINSFSDNYGAKWTGQSFMGRGEEFYKYGGFSRDISIGFTVAAQSKPELMAQYKKLNFLASNLAPTYSDYGYMGGPLIQLTLGGWCYELPGFIGSLGLGVPQESPWEIGINTEGGSDSTVKEMPHIVNVDMKFTPIHRFRPEKQELTFGKDENEVATYGPQRYIELTNGYNNNYVPVSLANARDDKGGGPKDKQFTTLDNLYSKQK